MILERGRKKRKKKKKRRENKSYGEKECLGFQQFDCIRIASPVAAAENSQQAISYVLKCEVPALRQGAPSKRHDN